MYNVYAYPLASQPFKHVSVAGGRREGEDVAALVASPFKLEASLSRTRRLFRDYALCNMFDLFVTITFDQQRYNSYSLKAVKKVLGSWFNEWRKKYPDFAYMLIPEKHESGAWHFHGFITAPVGLCTPLMVDKTYQDVHTGLDFLKSVPNTKHYMRWPAFSDKFGFFSCSFIRDYEKCVNYCLSYISKSFDGVIEEKNARLLIKSNNLQKPERVFSSPFGFVQEPDIDNDFCQVKWMSEDDSNRALLRFTHPWVFDPGWANVHQMTEFEHGEIYTRQQLSLVSKV